MAKILYNTGVMQVTGTGTAASLRALMNTASAGKGDAICTATNRCNYFILNPEGAVRFTLDGQTPTSAIGLMGATGAVLEYSNTDADKIIIINAQKVNIQCGFDDQTN